MRGNEWAATKEFVPETVYIHLNRESGLRVFWKPPQVFLFLLNRWTIEEMVRENGKDPPPPAGEVGGNIFSFRQAGGPALGHQSNQFSRLYVIVRSIPLSLNNYKIHET